MKLISKENMEKVLNFIYNKAVNGVAGMDSAYELAQDYKSKYPQDLNKQISSLVNWQCLKSGATGFVTNLGGLITLPVALPANITGVLLLQLRMIAAIAILCGYKPNNDRVQTLAYCCLIGDSINTFIKKAGVQLSSKIGYKVIGKIPYAVIKKINKEIGMKILTKFGQKGIINLWKFVPALGGVVAGGFDAVSTKTVGSFAKKSFISNDSKNFVYSG